MAFSLKPKVPKSLNDNSDYIIFFNNAITDINKKKGTLEKPDLKIHSHLDPKKMPEYLEGYKKHLEERKAALITLLEDEKQKKACLNKLVKKKSDELFESKKKHFTLRASAIVTELCNIFVTLSCTEQDDKETLDKTLASKKAEYLRKTAPRDAQEIQLIEDFWRLSFEFLTKEKKVDKSELSKTLEKKKVEYIDTMARLTDTEKNDVHSTENKFVDISYPQYVDSLNKLETFDLAGLTNVIKARKQIIVTKYEQDELTKKRTQSVEQYKTEFKAAYELPDEPADELLGKPARKHPDKLDLNAIDEAEDIPILRYAVKLNLPNALQAFLDFKSRALAIFDIDFVLQKRPDQKVGTTALHLAAELGNLSCLQLLLKRGANKDALDEDKRTPLHLAALYNQVEVIAELKNWRALFTAIDKNGKTPLALAMKPCAHQISSIANPDKPAEVPAIKAENTAKAILDEIPSAMMMQPASIQAAENVRPYTYLEIAIDNRLSAEFIVTLLEKYEPADLDTIINHKNSKEIAPLFFAVRNQCGINVISVLLKHAKIDVDTFDKDHRSVLQEAIALENYPEVVEVLLNKKAKVTKEDLKGNTTLIYALKHNLRFDYLETIIKNYGDDFKHVINKGNKEDENTPLHYAVVMKPPCWTDPIAKRTPSWTDVITLLVTSHEANLNVRNKKGETPLHIVLSSGDAAKAEKAEILLTNFAATRVDIDTEQGETTLMLAIKHKLPLKTIAKIIERYGASLPNFINKVNKEGKTAFFLLIESMNNANAKEVLERSKIVEYLISHAADVNKSTRTNRTPLQQSLINRDDRIAKILLATPNIKVTLSDDKGDTTLMHAVRNNIDSEVVMQIITAFKKEYLKPGSPRPEQETEEITEEIMDALNAHVNARNNEGNTALSIAIAANIDKRDANSVKNNSDVIDTLLTNDADPSSVDGKGHSTLFQSIIADKVEIATMFIDLTKRQVPKNKKVAVQAHASEQDSTNEKNKTFDSVSKEKPEQASSDVNQVEGPRKSTAPAHNIDLNKWPVEYAVKVHEKAEHFTYEVWDGRQQRNNTRSVVLVESSTALALALEKRFPVPFIIKLIDRYGAQIKHVINKVTFNYDDKQKDGRSPLYIALETRYPVAKYPKYPIELIQKLLEIPGIDVNSINTVDQRRPLHEAICTEQLEVIELLVSKGATITTKSERICAPALSGLILDLNKRADSPFKDTLFQKLIEGKCEHTLNALGISPLHRALISNDLVLANSMLSDAAEKRNAQPQPAGNRDSEQPAEKKDGASLRPPQSSSSGNTTILREEAIDVVSATGASAGAKDLTLPVLREPLQLSHSANQKLKAPDIYGQTSLQLLLQQNVRHKGLLLHQLIRARQKHLIIALLESEDFDVNNPDPTTGATPLILAVLQNDFDDIVNLLLSKGANAGYQLKSDMSFDLKKIRDAVVPLAAIQPAQEIQLLACKQGDTVAHIAARAGKESILAIFKSDPVYVPIMELRNNNRETPDFIFEKLKRSKNNNGSGNNSPRTASSEGTPTVLTPRSMAEDFSDPGSSPRAISASGTNSAAGSLPRSATDISPTSSSGTTPRTDASIAPLIPDTEKERAAREKDDREAADIRAAVNAPSNRRASALGGNLENINLDPKMYQRVLAHLKRNKWRYIGISAVVLLLLLSGTIAFGLFCVNPPAAFVWTITVGKAFTFVVTKTLIGMHIVNAATPVIKGLAIAVPEIASAALLSIAPAITFTISVAAVISSVVAAAVVTPIVAITTAAQVGFRFFNWLFDFGKSADLEEVNKPRAVLVPELEPDWANQTERDPPKKNHGS